MVRLHWEPLPEKFLIPAFVFFLFKLYPPAGVSDSRHATAGAAGGCMLARPAALEAAGGIEAMRHEVIDDCALAARIKRNGGRLWLGFFSDATRSIRPYCGFSDIGSMISRTAFNQLRHSTLILVLALLGMAVTFLFPPPLALFSQRTAPAVFVVATWLLLTPSLVSCLR